METAYLLLFPLFPGKIISTYDTELAHNTCKKSILSLLSYVMMATVRQVYVTDVHS